MGSTAGEGSITFRSPPPDLLSARPRSAMPTTFRTVLLLAALSLGGRGGARAQTPFLDPGLFLPTCVEQGVTRFALSVPPDRTREDLAAALARGEILPGGSEAFIFPDGAGPRLLNGE